MKNRENHAIASGFGKVYVMIGLLVIAGASYWGYAKLNNEMIRLEQRAVTQWQQVNVQLVRQYELIPKLVDIARAYAAHEEEVLANLTEARTRYQSSDAIDQPEAAGKLDQAVAGLFVLVERYPDLKADESFRDLSYEVAGTKNRIATERMRYNETVGIYNTRLRQFPWRLAAFGKPVLAYYTLPEEQLAEPEWEVK